ncbi:hypothetical protein, partial [Francisella philomiragia]
CPYIDKVTKDNTCGSGISIGLGVDSKDYNIAEETLNKYPTYIQAIEHSTRGMQVGVGGNITMELTSQNILNLMTAVYKIGKFLDKYKFYQTQINIYICDPNYKGNSCGAIGSIKLKDWSYMPQAQKNGWIEKENIKNWQSPIDVANIIRIWDEKSEEMRYLPQLGIWPEIQKLYKEQQA